MTWFAIVIAGCLEIFGVVNIKRLTLKKWDALIYIAATFGISFSLLSYAMHSIPMGTVYAVWTGIGTVGAACTGMFLYGEPKDWRRLMFMAMILVSAVGLKWVS